MSDRTLLFREWTSDCDSVTASELLAFSAYVGLTVSETIARLRAAGVEVIPDSSERL